MPHWLERVGVQTLFIEPGSPWENGSVEPLNGKLRDECLNRERFDTLLEAQILSEQWRFAYNHLGPHSSLGYRPPAPSARPALRQSQLPLEVPVLSSEVLLSNDQTFLDSLPSADGRREIERPTLRSADPAAGTHPVMTRVAAWGQGRFLLRDFEGCVPRPPRRRRGQRPPTATPGRDDLDRLYEERAAGRLSTRSMQTYRWLRKEMLACASAETGRRVVILDLFANPELLGRMLVSDRLANGRACSASTIAHRRTAIRSVATMLRPELQTALGCNPHETIRDALRCVAERRGGGYRIQGGTPRTQGGPTPTRDEVQAILAAMGRIAGWAGLRDRAFATLLGSTAARVTALRTLDAADCHVLPDDRVRIFLHQKNGRARHEVELDRAALRLYVFGFNETMQAAGRLDRIALRQPGPVWRTARGTQLPDRTMRAALRRACRLAGTRDYTPHAFRRAWATEAAAALPRWEAALGGGWRGTARFDASYVTPRRKAVWTKLSGLGMDDAPPRAEPERADDVPASAL